MSSEESLSDDLTRETAMLRRIARGIVLEPALAEDAVQEAWLAALRAGPQALSSGGWLTQAVRRIASGLKRREARQARRERAGARREQQPSAADTAARVELLRELLGALESLEEPYRTAVQLRLVDDLPPREIAERTGVPVETARTRVKRGVERLRAQLDARHAASRREFLALLAPLAGFDPLETGLAASASAKTVVGGALMSIKTQLGVAAALALAAGLFVWSPWSAQTGAGAPEELAATPGLTPPEPVERETTRSAPQPESDTQRAEQEPSRTTVATANASDWLVRGRVVDHAKRGLAGLEVRVRVNAGYEGEGQSLHDSLARTDSSGRFEAALAPPPSAALVKAAVMSERWFSGVEEALVLPGERAPELELRGRELDLALRGRVVDNEGRALAGARVRSFGKPSLSAADGGFEVYASSQLEEAWIDAFLAGFAPGKSHVQTLGVREPIEGLELVLERGGVLRGRVLDDAGRGVAGARIEFHESSEVRAVSGVDGRFELGSLPLDGRWLSVAVRAEGFARERVSFDDGRLPSHEHEIRLERAFDLSGVVTDERGAPLPRVSIGIGRGQYDADAARTTSGDGGRFTLRDVRAGKAQLFATLEGFAAHDVEFDSRLQRGALAIVLRKGGSLRGRTLDEHGAPLAGINVTLRSRDSYLDSRATSDADGRFELANVPEQQGLEVECYGAGRVRTNVRVAHDAREVKVVLQPAAGLCGRVVDAATGAPVARFRVRLIEPALQPGDESMTGYGASWSVGGREFSGSDGRWSMAGEELAAGMVTGIEITAAGYAPGRIARAVAVLAPEEQPLEIALAPPAHLEGRVLDARNGAPIADASLRVVLVSGPEQRAVDESAKRTLSNARGEFALRELSSDAIWLVVDAAGYARRIAGPFEPTQASAQLSIELIRGATLRGVLLDSAGAPLAGQTVNVTSHERRTGERRDWDLATDASGRFELAQLSAGTYEIARRLQRDQFGIFDLTREVELGDEGVREVELRPEGAIRVRGRVNSGAQPLDGTVSATKVGDESRWRTAFVFEGKFELDGLTPGRWRFFTSELGAGARHGEVELELAGGADALVEITVGER